MFQEEEDWEDTHFNRKIVFQRDFVRPSWFSMVAVVVIWITMNFYIGLIADREKLSFILLYMKIDLQTPIEWQGYKKTYSCQL